MTREDDRREAEQTELEQVWQLVDELGDLSVRLKRAAEAALKALESPPEEEKK